MVAPASNSKNGAHPNIITLSNGVRLRMRAVAPLTIRRASMRVPRPQIPKVYLDDKGREEENPADPTYLAALDAYEDASREAGLDAVILLGTSVESVPDDMYPVDNDTWVEDLRFLGIEVDADDSRARYLAWLRYYAVQTDADTLMLLAGPLATAGAKEEDVAASVDSFPGRAVRRANRKRATAARRRDGS